MLLLENRLGKCSVFKHKNIFSTILAVAAIVLTLSASNLPFQEADPETLHELSGALTDRLAQYDLSEMPLTFELFQPKIDTAFISQDGNYAALWLALQDDHGRSLVSEPGFAVALAKETGWQVLLPGDPSWEETLAALPTGMLPLGLSPGPADLEPSAFTQALSGYYLPYVAGSARWLEGSVSHFHYLPWLGYPSCAEEFCRYAYDFTDAWHFPLLASKAGIVYASRDSCPDGGETCTNFIVLYEPSVGVYQLYLHLAYGTIPNKLTPGTSVARGEYIGDSDDTGYSTSQHVHFMVTDSVWLGGDGYYWGRSIDMRFADVSLNGGIPRTCYEVTHLPIYSGATECIGNRNDPLNPNNDWFLSGNTGAYPPTGELTQPAAGAVVLPGTNPNLDITAEANDDVRVEAVRMMAKINGTWIQIGAKITQPVSPGVYDWDVDLCQVGPINGNLDVGLRVWDYEGNMSDVLSPHTIYVDHACPPPVSQLNPAITFDSTAVKLTWTTSTSGVPLSSFELQWRRGSEGWKAQNTLVQPAWARSTWFVGDPGFSYYFRLRALDANGQAEAWPAGGAAETSADLPASCVADSSEPDDSAEEARLLGKEVRKQRNLCGPGDPDWFKVQIDDPGAYLVSVRSISGGAAVKMTVYNESLTEVLAVSQAQGVAKGDILVFRSQTAGRVYIKAEPLMTNLMGTEAVYGIKVMPAVEMFLPMITQ